MVAGYADNEADNELDFDDSEITEALQRAFAALDRWPEPEPREEYMVKLTPQQYTMLAKFLHGMGVKVEPTFHQL